MHPFRQGLLRGHSIALSGAVPHEVTDLLQTLGAQINQLDPGQASDEEGISAWAKATGRLDALVCGPGSGGCVGAAPEIELTLASLEHDWAVLSAAANAFFIPARRGRIVLLAPRPGELPHAEPARAALENLARTLSVEWARFEIRIVAITPGASTSAEELAHLVAFLCSPAGAYYTGCRFDLGLVDRPTPA